MGVLWLLRGSSRRRAGSSTVFEHRSTIPLRLLLFYMIDDRIHFHPIPTQRTGRGLVCVHVYNLPKLRKRITLIINSRCPNVANATGLLPSAVFVAFPLWNLLT